jgi:hypothetical protein
LASGNVVSYCIWGEEEEEDSIYMIFYSGHDIFIFSIQADESCQKINLAVI